MSEIRLNPTDDVRIDCLKPLIPPQILVEEIPLTDLSKETVSLSRAAARAVVKRDDDRLIVIVGPCSIHDPDAAKEYAMKLAPLAKSLSSELLVIMRVYFEKPRTTVGWKGLINDPNIDGSFAINKGLRLARGLLSTINDLGLPCACEYLDTLSPQWIGDLVTWAAIGARTTESQVHRELASGSSTVIGFKNGSTGDVGIAVDAIRAASKPHTFLSVTKQGLCAIVATTGNDTSHVVLRGGSVTGPNFSQESISACAELHRKVDVDPRIMVDCSHANSGKDHKKQGSVAAEVARQVAAGNTDICGVMIESNLQEGRQDMHKFGPKYLQYGVSITDACIGWEETVEVLHLLAESVRARRAVVPANDDSFNI